MIPFFLLTFFFTIKGKLFLLLLFIFYYQFTRNHQFKKKIKQSLLIFFIFLNIKTTIQIQKKSPLLAYPPMITKQYNATSLTSLPQLANVFWNIKLPSLKYHPRKKNATRKEHIKYIGSRLVVSSITFVRSCYRLKEIQMDNEFPFSLEHFVSCTEMLFSFIVASDLFLPKEKKIDPALICEAFIFYLTSDSFYGSSVPMDPDFRNSLQRM